MGPNHSSQGFSTREMARMAGVSEGEVRACVRGGFLEPGRGPRGEFLFSFQDLVVLRAAQGLRGPRISSRRVRRALQRLRGTLPPGRTLASVRFLSKGGRILVQEEAETWEAETGQGLLDFGAPKAAAGAAPLARRALRMEERKSADEDFVEDLGGAEPEDLYALGCQLEAESPREAEEVYQRLLHVAPQHADARLNLGRLLHERGALQQAEACYRAALELQPAEGTAAFNLGVVLQDLGQPEQAIDAYRRAIELDPTCADAYFNLAGLYERFGLKAAAIRHLKAYRRLTRG